MNICMVSSCLLGLKTRYDGRVMPSIACLKATAGSICIPVCPEQLGGLATPRTPADIVGGDGFDVLAGRARVITRTGQDVTANFILGARQVLEIAGRQKLAQIILKARSPSCGLMPTIGVTAALLQEHAFAVIEME